MKKSAIEFMGYTQLPLEKWKALWRKTGKKSLPGMKKKCSREFWHISLA